MAHIDDIKRLREETGVSPVEVKKALAQAGDDFEKAKELLRAWGVKVASKKTAKEATQGIVDFYIHPNAKTGVLLDIRCETDFVAKSADFKNLAHEICLHIAAIKPLFTSEDTIPAEVLDSETRIYEGQVAGSGKPESIVRQIVDGKLKKYKESVSLLDQPWVKDDTKTVKNLIEDTIAKVGENIEIKRFARYEI